MTAPNEEFDFWSPTLPPNETTIWRYRDFTQFLSILDREALWFNRADRFPDPYEGSFPEANVRTRKLRYAATDIPEETFSDQLPLMAEKFRQSAYLNCWHMNEYESAAMWDIYINSNQVIAIQSTVGQLRQAVNEPDNGCKVEIDVEEEESDGINYRMKLGEVQYIDYSSQLIPENNTFATLYHKRKSYEHEREFRAAITDFGDKLRNRSMSPDADFSSKPGDYIEVDLEILFGNVYIAPTAPDWFFELTKSVINKYDFDIDIGRSSLDADPVF